MTEVALAAAGLVAVVALWWVAAHNRFVQQRQHIVESWRDVVALAEAHPQLRSSASFLSLQRELAETEDRLEAARRTHASNVERYNSRVDTLPTRLVARTGGFERSSYVEIAAS